ncbi:AAR2 protein, putative [Plasmodium ovale wallikeri]|uniref:AAR2 protein, putative n=1 Tax=Plasmodium ovale wallikeri TaxID=864142 RepID=A0A1A8ZRY0_PLAOA|nr:AAR2 protein, putative [Plasmodium ovale wallikeri]SBT47474.1 AAR2 protein, putative [Plasmodium ovale wallikeri]
MSENIHVYQGEDGISNHVNNSFVYNDKCSLVLILDCIKKEEKRKRDKNKNSEDDSSTGMTISNVQVEVSAAEGVNSADGASAAEGVNSADGASAAEGMNSADGARAAEGVSAASDVSCRMDIRTERSSVERAILKDVKKEEKKEKSKKDAFKESIKLQIGLDYSNFELDTPFKIIKFINKGSHFLYWNSDISVNKNSNITKEFKMNEMKKNNCEEMRNSRFLYFDIDKKLLVLKYNIKYNNFNYIREDDSIYKYFFHLHEKDFLDDTIIKEQKNSILIYPCTYTKMWKSLTCYINEELINKIEPVNKTFCSSFLKDEKENPDLNREEDMNLHNQPYMFYSVIPKYPQLATLQSSEEKRSGLISCKREKKEDTMACVEDGATEDDVDEEGTPEDGIFLSGDGEKKSYFECIYVDSKHKKYIPSDLTQIHLEKYWILKEIIQQEYTYIYYDNEKKEGFHKFENKLFYILGEFQFAFILFHLGFNYQSFMQWRKLFELVSNSQHLVTNYSGMEKFTGTTYDALK